jgi:FkbM family methyltransferase
MERRSFRFLTNLLLGNERGNFVANQVNFGYVFAKQGLYGTVHRYDKNHCVVSRHGFTFICSFGDLSLIDEVSEVYQLPSEGNTVIDVGGHYGFYSLPASRAVGKTGKVFAFEPCYESFKFLLANCRVNNLNNVLPFQIALSDFDGIDKLFYGRTPSSHSMIRGQCLGYENVRVNRLDTIVEQLLKLDKVDMIKIDAEGAELRILKGAEKSLKRFKPRLFIASYHYAGEAEEIDKWLNYLDYDSSRVRILT